MLGVRVLGFDVRGQGFGLTGYLPRELLYEAGDRSVLPPCFGVWCVGFRVEAIGFEMLNLGFKI